MAVTASQIKTVIDTAITAANQNLRTYDYAPPEKRRVYPCLEIVIPSKSEDKDIKKITYTQKFRLVLSVRQRGMAEPETTYLDTIEPIIISALDGIQLAKDKLFLQKQDWTRAQSVIAKPVPHYESYLDVYVIDIESQTGQGTIGARISIDLPGFAGLQLLSKPVSPNRMKSEDVYSDDKRRVYVAPVGHARAELFEVEMTPTLRNAVNGFITAKAPISITLHKGTDTETLTVLITEMDEGAGYMDLDTLIIRAEVFDS